MGVYVRPDSKYFWIDIEPPDGRPRVRQSTKIRCDAPTPEQRKENRQLADQAYHAAYLKVAKRLHGHAEPKPARPLAAQLAWYRQHVTPHKRGAAREREILTRLEADLGPVPLTDLTVTRVREWMTARRAAVSAATVNRELDVLKHVVVSAVPTHLDASPIAGLRRLRVVRRALAVLTRDEERRILAVLAPADQTIIIAALDTLLRASDLLRLEWRHDHGRHLEIVDPKTGKPYTVPISARLRAALDRLKGKRRKPRGPIFAHRRRGKEPRTWTHSLKQMFEDACGRATPPVTYGRAAGGVTFHALRHTAATRLVEAGVSLRTIQALGGWSDLRQISRYAHPSEAALVAAVALLGDVTGT